MHSCISKIVLFTKFQRIVHSIWVWLCIGCTRVAAPTSRVQWKLKPAASNEEEEEGGREPNNDGEDDDDDGGDDGGDVDEGDGRDRCVDDDAKPPG